jgi:hypothetical protein
MDIVLDRAAITAKKEENNQVVLYAVFPFLYNSKDVSNIYFVPDLLSTFSKL